MAKNTPLTLKDLIAKQREMAAAGDTNAVKQLARLEELAEQSKEQTEALKEIKAVQPEPKLATETQKILKQDRILQVVQTLEARKADKDDDRIADATESLASVSKKGLLDKTGDGLNANVVELLKVMSNFTSGIVPQGIAPQPLSNTPKNEPPRTPESQKGRPGAVQYTKQEIQKLVEGRVESQGEKARPGAIGYVKQEFKKLGTLGGWFDTSESKGQGLIGQAVMRKQAEGDFVKDQLATGATANEDLARKRFNKVNDLRLQGGELVKETAGMRERGLSEDQIARTGILDKQQSVDDRIAIANPLYRETRQETITQQARPELPAPPVAANVIPFPTPATAATPVVTPATAATPVVTPATAATPVVTPATAATPVASNVIPFPTPATAATPVSAATPVIPFPTPATAATPVATPVSAATPVVAPATAATPVSAATPVASNVIPFPTPATAVSAATPVASAATPANSSEQAAENLRMMAEQNETLKQIEENTRGLSQISKKEDKNSADKPKEESRGLLGSIADLLAGRGISGILRRGGGLLRRAGQGIVRGAAAVASRAAPLIGAAVTKAAPIAQAAGRGIVNLAAKAVPIAQAAGQGIVNAASSIASKAAPILSQVGSTAANVASKAVPAIQATGQVVSQGAAAVASKAAPIVQAVGQGASTAAGAVAPAAAAAGQGIAKVGATAANAATVAAPVASKAGGILSKAGGLAKGILGKAALPLAAGMAVYDGVTGYKDAAENLGIEGREATTGEKASSAAGSVVSGLTFGLLDKQTASKGIASFFGAGAEKDKATPVEKEQISNLTPEQKAYREAAGKKAEAEANFKKFDEGQVEGKDYKYKTAMDEFTDKRTYSDPKKQEEFQKLKTQRYEADTLQQKAVASRMEKDGVLGEKRVDPKAPRNLQENQKTEGTFKDTDAKLAALEKSGYKRDQFISKDPTNYVQTKDGKKYDKVAIDAVYNRDVQKELAGPDQAKTVTPRSADAVYNKSSENAAVAQQPASQAPVVINAPTTNSVQQTQNYSPKSPPRNTESSYQQYNRSKYAY